MWSLSTVHSHLRHITIQIIYILTSLSDAVLCSICIVQIQPIKTCPTCIGRWMSLLPGPIVQALYLHRWNFDAEKVGIEKFSRRAFRRRTVRYWLVERSSLVCVWYTPSYTVDHAEHTAPTRQHQLLI